MNNEVLNQLKGKVIISVQAMPSEPLYDEVCINALIKSVVNGGASGLRVAGERDVRNAKRLTSVPVIGITKPEKIPANYKELVYITPSQKMLKNLLTQVQILLHLMQHLEIEALTKIYLKLLILFILKTA